MKVVVAHDYVTQRGGAERVVLELLECFPDTRLVTSVFEPTTTYPEFGHYEVETLWLNRFKSFRKDPRRAFPLLARAFNRHVIRDADLVIASSSGWAHRVHTQAPKIVYCHNPARWLYQPHDYLHGLSPRLRELFAANTQRLRHSDNLAATTASAYLVNSRVVGERVRDAYGIDARVVPPARGLSPDGEQRPISGIEPGYLLTIGRSRGYKNTEVVCNAIGRMGEERLVVVGGLGAHRPERPGVTVLPRVGDAELRWLYANADALVAVSYEDFGLTPVEAQAFGVPSVVLRGGGYLDSTAEGVTGIFVDEATAEAVVNGVRLLRERNWSPEAIRGHGERFSPTAFCGRMQDVVDKVLANA